MAQGLAGKIIAATAVGIAVGTAFGFYALAPNVPGRISSHGAGNATRQERENQEAARQSAENSAKASNDVLAQVANLAVRDALKDKRIVLFRTPDANSSTLDSTRKTLEGSGAAISTTITLTDAMLSQDKGDEVKSIVANSLPAGAQLSEKNLSPGMHTGQLLGAALAIQARTSQADQALALGALQRSGFIAFDGASPQQADVALIITGDTPSGYAASFIADFSRGLREQMGGVVTAGTNASARETGALGKIRSNADYRQRLSTVDNVDTAAGQITIVRAMKEQLEAKAGQYGSAPNAQAATVA